MKTIEDFKYEGAFNTFGKNDTQNIFTPPRLIRRMLNRIDFTSNGKVLVWYNVEFLIYLVNEVGLSPKNIYIYTNTEDKLIFEKQGYNVLFQDEINLDKINDDLKKMKFNVVIGNPPYTIGKNKTIWNLFVEKSFELCDEDGYIALIHPNGWRNIGGRFGKIQNLIKNKEVQFLSMNNIGEGRKTFNVDTPFDWYVIKNKDNNNFTTKVKFQDGTSNEIQLNDFEFIPNFKLDEIRSLIAGKGEEKVCVLHSESLYEIRQSHMSSTQNEEFHLPCVYSVLKNGTPTLKYSREDRGYFGTPKVIFGNGANPTSFIDYNGNYGMTQFAFAIADSPDNLERIEKALKSDKFAKITEATKYVATAGNPLVYPKILKTFRKNFWEEFIDE